MDFAHFLNFEIPIIHSINFILLIFSYSHLKRTTVGNCRKVVTKIYILYSPHIKSIPAVSEEELLEYSTDPDMIENGASCSIYPYPEWKNRLCTVLL
jgi:hypothetical protein